MPLRRRAGCGFLASFGRANFLLACRLGSSPVNMLIYASSNPAIHPHRVTKTESNTSAPGQSRVLCGYRSPKQLQALLHRLLSSGAPDPPHARSSAACRPGIPARVHSGRLTFSVLLPPHQRRSAMCRASLNVFTTPTSGNAMFNHLIDICAAASLCAAAALFCALSFEALRDV